MFFTFHCKIPLEGTMVQKLSGWSGWWSTMIRMVIFPHKCLPPIARIAITRWRGAMGKKSIWARPHDILKLLKVDVLKGPHIKSPVLPSWISGAHRRFSLILIYIACALQHLVQSSCSRVLSKWPTGKEIDSTTKPFSWHILLFVSVPCRGLSSQL